MMNLHEHVVLRGITLSGRVVRSATELFCSYPDGHVHPYEFSVYDELSRSGAGMILTAHTCVSPVCHRRGGQTYGRMPSGRTNTLPMRQKSPPRRKHTAFRA